ncbi:MAG: hypothetical protein KFH98_03740 [Gemmatimonadetes bacterium]|nr:hypothetical protein [Gemmatimonadota bacterium]
MIVLTIGETSRRLSDAAGIEENWVAQRMRSTVTPTAVPGVHVRIDSPSVSLNLSAGDGEAGGRIGRPLRPEEAKVVALWEERGLDRPDFRSGQLVAFLHQLYDVLDQVLSVLPPGIRLETESGPGSSGIRR